MTDTINIKRVIENSIKSVKTATVNGFDIKYSEPNKNSIGSFFTAVRGKKFRK